MISEYKLYHGAVLAELVSQSTGSISVDELHKDGRLSFYIINGKLGLYVKYCTNRLHPWQFTLSKANVAQLYSLRQRVSDVFLLLVCHTDGIVALTLSEIMEVIAAGASDQAWIRVDRRRREWYSVSGAAGELSGKRPHGIGKIIQALEASR